MNTALAIAALAIITQLYDAPSVPTNGTTETLVQYLQPYAPDEAYAGAAVTGESMAYLGGVTWQIGKRWGVGAEYRQWNERVRFARARYKATGHLGGAYLYRELPPIDRLVIRTEIGAGVLETRSELDIGTTWAASIRASARLALSERLSLVVWTGGARVGSASVASSRHAARTGDRDFVDTGIALIVRLK
jgi:hypothetical protein